jgi:FlaG/FlaF family flagellin (archaellin)
LTKKYILLVKKDNIGDGVIMMPASRKAVSPLIATLLLVLISIAAASLIYVFVTSYISGSAGQRPTAQSQIVIEAASLNVSIYPNVTVYVRNVGQQEIPSGNWSIYLYDLNGTMIGYNYTVNILSSLGPGSLLRINATVTNTTAINSGSYYDVKAVSPVGTFDVVRVRASKQP